MQKRNPHEGGFPFVTRLLIAGGALGPLLFVVILLLEGATRPGYNAWREFGSLLSLGDLGWMQIANFVMCGILVLGFAVGLRLVLRSGKGALGGPLLLGIFGLSLIAAGLFVTDPSPTYPPGSVVLAHPTVHGMVHALSGLVAFLSVAAASIVLARRFAAKPAWRGWALYSILTALIIVVFFFAQFEAPTLAEHGILPGSPIGLIQRVAIIAGWSWISCVAFRLWSLMRS